MKKSAMKIMTTNVNGYHHSLSKKKFNKRLEEIFAYFRPELPDVWAMQEAASGGSGLSCLTKLKELAAAEGYTLILPDDRRWDPNENPRSIFNALLLKDVREVVSLEMNRKIGLFGRYNYVKASFNTAPDEPYYIINVHAPQTGFFPGRKTDDPYVADRKELAKEYYDALRDEVRSLISSGAQLILLGDFNRSLRDAAVSALGERGMTPVTDGIQRTNYGPVTDMAIDHILLSADLAKRAGRPVVDQDISRVEKLTDHAAVSIELS